MQAKKLYPIMRVGVSLFFIGLLVYLRKGSFGPTLEAIKGLNPSFFVLSSVVFISGITIVSLRLRTLLSAQGFSLKFRETAYLTFIGYFFNNFLPTSIGGDVVKGYYASKKTSRKLDCYASVLMDRMVGFLTMFMLAGISIIFSREHIKEPYMIWVTFAMLAVLLVIFAALFNRSLGRRLPSKIRDTAAAFRDKKGLIFRAGLFSVAAQVVCFSTIYILARGMHAHIDMKMVFLLLPLVSIASMMPSINGLGVRESAIYFLFGPYIGYKNALALGILWLFMLFLVSIIGGIGYLLNARQRS